MLQTDAFKLDDYLQRIAYTGDVRPDSDCLKSIIRAHGQAIPFENLDVMAYGTINLEPEHLVNKIVYGGRGGYCYEVNAIVYLALQAAGFTVQLVAARPRIFPVLRPRTHMAVVAELDGQYWLCDPAFGGQMPAEPICLASPEEEICQGADYFKITLDAGQGEYYLYSKVDGDWQAQYSFTLNHQEWVDFAPGNYLNSTHPDSFFRQQPAMVIFTAEGRNLLFGNRLKIMKNGVTETRLLSKDEFDSVFQTHFRVTGNYTFNPDNVPETRPK
ncbi:MAG: arylamine N-acetyltransferase family protein [Thiolinea sp.]